ncbi:MAG: PHP domain-containing protein [Candidatus Thermoplasmatota archaeon]|nr:PHP domain-containing protein [Candidatus Thermoplasmatota archaeon]
MGLPYRDLHVHTHHSHDVRDDGSTMENLARWGAEAGIAVGFADHLDTRHFGMGDLWAREENIGAYLEEFDEVKAKYPGTTLGIELEYFPDRPELMDLTQDWLDRYRKDLDRVLGSAHHVYGDHAVTWHVHLRQLVGVHTFEEIMDEYLRGERAMVASGIADCIPHADVVFRGHRGIFEVPPEVARRGRDEVMALCRDAISMGMAIECNLLGVVDDTHPDPSPSWDMLEELAKEGAVVYVGSDAHDTAGFQKAIPLVIETHERLRNFRARFLISP